MAVDFKTSETAKNLMRAFAGESQARNRYTFAASQAKKQKPVSYTPLDVYKRPQEYHMPIYHYLCMELEKRLFSA